jgi:hypothetical protein
MPSPSRSFLNQLGHILDACAVHHDSIPRLSTKDYILCSTKIPSSQGRRRDRVNHRRSAMSQTVRQMIIDILLEGPATAKELSARVRIWRISGEVCIMASSGW